MNFFWKLKATLKEWFPDGMAYFYLLLSIIIAGLYWGVTVTEEKENKTIPAEVKFTDVKEGYSIVGPDAHTKVNVEISATTEVLRKITSDDIKVVISAKQFKEGPFVYELTENDVTLPSSVTFVNIFPKVLELQLDKNVVKTIPLKPQFTGKLKNGKSILFYEVDPPEVEVYGPRTIVESLKFIPSQPIQLSDKENNFTIPVVPIIDDPELKVSQNTNSYTLKVVVGGKKKQSVINNVKVECINKENQIDFVLNPDHISAVVEYDEKESQNIKAEEMVALIDLTNLTPSEKPYKIKPLVEKRRKDEKSFHIVSFFPTYIEVTLKERQNANNE
jgi:YbbR domain-containing protein